MTFAALRESLKLEKQMAAPADAAPRDAAQRVGELFEAHRSSLYSYLCRLSGDSSLAEELVQETFLRVHRTRERLAEIESERAWVFRIATNLCFAAMRRRRRFAWLPWEVGGEAERTHDAADEVLRRDTIERALGKLPENYRAPLLLFSHQGLSVAEVARVLEITPGAVKTRVYRAKELFQRAYEQETGE